MKTVIIDYGMGNLKSVRRAFEECGANVLISDSPDSLEGADRIILPGVGAFGDGISNLSKGNWIDAIKKAVLIKEKPILGICLGMQLFSTMGYENGENPGLDLIQGNVVKFQRIYPSIRIPHVGWNELHKKGDSVLLKDISEKADFYFVHSYHFEVSDRNNVIATTPYAGEFVSAVQKGNIFGVQFHPEKSHKMGSN